MKHIINDNWIVEEQTFDIYICLNCGCEISESLYLTEKLRKGGHEHFRITVDRESGKRSWHPHYPFQQLRRHTMLNDGPMDTSHCSKQDYALNMDYVYPVDNVLAYNPVESTLN